MKTLRLKLTAAVMLIGTLAANILAQSTWHLRYPLPTPHGLLGVTYANGLHVAVGYHNTILTSLDAVTWTRCTPESDILLTDVLHTGGHFLAVGYRHSVDYRPEPGWEPIAVFLTSTNGFDWTSREVRQAFIPNQVIAWRDLLVSLGHVLDDAHGRFLRVVATSPNGQIWTDRWRDPTSTSGPNDGGGHQFAVTESSILASADVFGQSWICSTNGVDWRAISPDTCVWTNTVPGFEFGSNIKFGNGSHLMHTVSRKIRSPNGWVVVGQPQSGQAGVNNFARIFTSADGIAWTNRLEAQPFYSGARLTLASMELQVKAPGFVGEREGWGYWVGRSPTGIEWSTPDFVPDPAAGVGHNGPDHSRATDGKNPMALSEMKPPVL